MESHGEALQTGRLPRLTKYELLEEIGHGGMATVYRARDPRLAREVAIKVIHPHLRHSPEIVHRFSVEAKAVAMLKHPNIVEVFDVSAEDEADQYLVVELVRGVTLRRLLQIHPPMPPEVAAAIGVELLQALIHAHHAGVVHRDIKPENVIIEHREPRDSGATPSSPKRGERVVVKLTDFGIAKLLDAQGVTSTGQVLGSPAHMAPEQIEGGDVDGRADVFGLGVLLYECMAGHLPFEGNNPAQVLRRVLEGRYTPLELENPTVGTTWSRIIDCALAQKAEERYRDAHEFCEVLMGELRRLDIDSPRAELEAWLDGQDSYATEHTKRMLAVLTNRAEAARKQGDVLRVAADYNRALAYAPTDPALLRLVAGLNRSDRRKRIGRQLARVAATMTLLGGIAYFTTSAIRTRGTGSTIAQADPVAPPSASVASPPTVADLPVTPPEVSAKPSTPSTAIAPRPSTQPSAVPVRRSLVVGSARPPQLEVSIDGEPPVSASAGSRIDVDGHAHRLRFTCPQDMCLPMDRALPEGESDAHMDVSLTIKPALLTVEGDPAASYEIEQHPHLTIRPGVAANVPMRSGREEITVIQLPSNERRQVTVTAGKGSSASFRE